MTTRRHQLRIANDGKVPILFQIEPECHQFTVAPDEDVLITYDYDEQPLELRLGETSDSVFGAIVPGDGDVFVENDGKNVLTE